MYLLPIDVEADAGFKRSETPRRFEWLGRIILVERILDRWYQSSQPGRPASLYFKTMCDDGREYLLQYNQEDRKWFLVFKEI